ncbi:MAG: sigma-54-dependent Fis family transcriptional regulator [Nitrospinae bacterium]|nr:sigma-54-dependent Fis family transcriptional regulator [Nitrospinota bacterium]
MNEPTPKLVPLSLLVVDDDEAFRELLLRHFDGAEMTVTGFGGAEEALEGARRQRFDVGVLDIMMPGLSGMELLRRIKKLHPAFEAIVLTGKATVDSAIEAMKLGAYDYLAKPCKLRELEVVIRKAYEKKRLAEQNTRLKEELKRRAGAATLVGVSPVMEALREQVEKLAPSPEPVLIVGEIGVGKEVTAMALHRHSPRKEGAFISVNCGVLSEGLLEAELFGYEADAFVGAGSSRKAGILEFAEGGTVFLDEVDQLSFSLQVKILHFLDTGEFRRIGGFADLTVDTRLVMATTKSLSTLTKQGSFREDLYYRISALSLRVPPLRERKEDIPQLTASLLAQNPSALAHSKTLSKKAVESLMEYHWPGNVRELTNVLERAVSLAPKSVIQVKDLPLSFEKKSKSGKNRHLLPLTEIEKEHILYVLDAVNGNISKAAKILGVSRPKLYRKIERYRASTPSLTVTDGE